MGGVTLIQETNGWKYYSDGTAIGPDGTYYSQGQAITGPGGNTSVVKQDVMYTCPDGTKVQSSDAKLCPKKSQYVDSCSEKGTQLNSPCVPEQGGAGACKFNLKTNAFVCIGYRM